MNRLPDLETGMSPIPSARIGKVMWAVIVLGAVIAVVS